MNADQLQSLADELELLRLLATLAQSVDDRDEAGYRSCLADEMICLSESGDWISVSGGDYARRSVEAVSRMEWTHHKLCNPVVKIANGYASANADVVVDMEFVEPHGRREHMTVGGRYNLEFVRSNEGWRIKKRHLVRRYVISDTKPI